MIKKGLIIGGLVLLATAGVQAQQLGQFSQYVQNPFILNPAAAGIYDYTDINLSMRRQWAGISNAPNSYYASVNARLTKQNSAPSYQPTLRMSMSDKPKENAASPMPTAGKLRHGLGGYIAQQGYGAFKRLSGNISYALHVPLGKKFYGSLGLGLGASNLAFDQSLVQMTDAVDNTYANFIAGGTSSTFLDLNAGIWIYSDNLFFGYSTNQLLGDKVAFGDNLGQAELQVHHFATAGYKIQAGDNMTLTPSFMLKLMSPSPASLDVNLKAEFKEMFWLGVSYRHTDAIAGMLGLTLNNRLKVGYSYDYTLSTLNNYSSGSHEIVLGVMLGGSKK
jgi:type IX secretion system PorP/SprF family membrane protein